MRKYDIAEPKNPWRASVADNYADQNDCFCTDCDECSRQRWIMVTVGCF